MVDKEKKNKSKNSDIHIDSSMITHNEMLLSLEGWIKYVEGFSKGIQSADNVNSSLVLDCVDEILAYMIQLKQQIGKLFIHCENILEENEQLKTKMEHKLITTEEITDESKL